MGWLKQAGSCTLRLSATDFSFSGELGSDGAKIEEIGENHFLLTLQAVADKNTPNLPQFEIIQNAKGNSLRLDVYFADNQTVDYPCDSYFMSWSHDLENWHPLEWEKQASVDESGKWCFNAKNTMVFPEFTEDRVYLGVMVPLLPHQIENRINVWAEHADVTRWFI
jgi:hypothetical protein